MMPAGEYYIGDLCYVMTDEEWDEFCSITIKGNECLDGEFNMKDGRRFATYSTRYGDGQYFDNRGHSFAVDAGLIGCILVSDIKKDLCGESIEQLGARVKFDSPFTTTGGRRSGNDKWDGVIRIGYIDIDTDPEINEDGYDPWS